MLSMQENLQLQQLLEKQKLGNMLNQQNPSLLPMFSNTEATAAPVQPPVEVPKEVPKVEEVNPIMSLIPEFQKALMFAATDVQAGKLTKLVGLAGLNKLMKGGQGPTEMFTTAFLNFLKTPEGTTWIQQGIDKFLTAIESKGET